MTMRTWFEVPFERRQELEGYTETDIIYQSSLCERFIGRYSAADAMVFDPFAGFGTTLQVAKRLGRRAFGVELHATRYEYVRRTVGEVHVVQGDVLTIAEDVIPAIDLLLTSPPYWDPAAAAFTAYTTPDAGYEHYLARMRELFARLRPKFRDGGVAVVVLQNVQIAEPRRKFYPLAWDVARILESLFTLEHEQIACLVSEEEPERYGDHMYCLIARAG